MRPRQSALALVLVALFAGCATPVDRGSDRPSASALVAELSEGTIESGRYTYAAFTPRIELVVGEGWQVAHLLPEFFDVARGSETGFSAVMFHRPSRIFGPPEGGSAATPEEAVALLGQNPGLEVSEAAPVEIGGLSGLQVDLAAPTDDTQVLAGAQPLLGIGPSNEVRLAFFAVDGGLLVIGLVSPAGEMEAWAATAEPVLESVAIGE